jgi:hypothetical protein
MHWLTWLQLGVSAALLGAIAERAHYLLFRAKLSEEGWAFVQRGVQAGELAELRAFARAQPHAHVSAVLRAAFDPNPERDDGDLAELLSSLHEQSAARLRVVRVGATLASSLGLLVGILCIRRGFGEPAGLLALEAGLPQKLAMSQALFAMAIGVATSAVCFYALSLLRPAAQALVAQSARAAHLVQDALASGAAQALPRPT